MLVIGIFTFDVTGSPFVVTLMLFARLLPMGVFGIFGGLISDHFDRRRTLLFVFSLMAALSACLGIIGFAGSLTVWHVGIGSFIAGMVWVTDFPVRRTLLSEIAGPERTHRAMSLDIMSSSGTRVLGPLLGGTLYATLGIGGAFIATAMGYLLCVLILLPLRHRDGRPGIDRPSPLQSIIDGFLELRRNRTLVGIFVVTIIFNLWGFPFTSMIPVIGKDVLSLAPDAVGLLASSEGLGSLLGGTLLALYAPGHWARYLYVGGVGGYLLVIIAFGLSSDIWLSAVTLTIAGLAGAGFAAMQSALVLIVSTEETRARMMGILSMCIGTGLLGFLHLGWLADAIGPGPACVVLGIEGTVALIVSLWLFPELLRRQ